MVAVVNCVTVGFLPLQMLRSGAWHAMLCVFIPALWLYADKEIPAHI